MLTKKLIIRNLHRPDWSKPQKRFSNRLWLDKNELFLDDNFNEFKKILKKIKPNK